MTDAEFLERLVTGLNELTKPVRNTFLSVVMFSTGAGVVAAGGLAIAGGCAGSGGLACGAAIYGGTPAAAGGVAILYTGYRFTVEVTIPSWEQFFSWH